MTQVNSESSVSYKVKTDASKEEDSVIRDALSILSRRMNAAKSVLDSPDVTANYLKLSVGQLQYETFGILYLDNHHGVISDGQLFRGTINGASVHPREVVRECIMKNASAVIFYHNHPSGEPEPSEADKALTTRLIEALELIEVRVLDHIIVGGSRSVSFAERGYL